MTACPRPEELTRLLDGEVTENRAAELRAHVAACARCGAEGEAQRQLVALIAAPPPERDGEGAVEAVLRRLAAPEPVPRRPRIGIARVLRPLAIAATAIVALALLPRATHDRGEFAARGASVAWTRKVGVELWALEGPPRRLSAGDALPAGVGVVASFSNVDASPAYLLAFALDARGEVHWLYPGFTDRESDPESVRLDASVVQRALPESVILQDVAPGSLRFVFIVTREPVRVSSIESASEAERSPAALRARWPEARVDELPLTFGSSPSRREVRP